MKKFQFIFICTFLLLSIKLTAQCSVNAGQDITITCGGSTQLNAEPKWILMNSGTSSDLLSLYFTDSGTGYAAGAAGTILKTINSGASWIKQTSGTTNLIKCLSFFSGQIGYAFGGDYPNSLQLKTTNGGSNWVNLPNTPFPYSNYSTYFVSKDTGYIAADLDVYKTSDGGSSWLSKSNGTSYQKFCIRFVNKTTGYVAGSNGAIYKTVNGADLWTAQTSGTDKRLKSIFFLDENLGFIVGEAGTILKTVNGGTNWTKQISTVTDDLNSVFFINSTTGYAVGANGTILKTINGGDKWIKSPEVTTSSLNSIFFIGSGTGYIAGNNGIILKLTSPDSYSWSPTSGLDNNTIANPIVSVSETTSYVVTTNTNGCSAKDTIKITVSPLIANAGVDKNIICGGTAQLNSVTTNYTGTGTLKYKWTPATGLNNDTIANPTATVTNDITYTVTVSTPNGCTASDDIKVTVSPLIANAGVDKTIICGGTAQLNSVTTNYTGTGTLKYKWTPATGLNNDTIANPTATLINNVIYTITVNTPNGCIATDQVSVNITPMAKPEIGIVGVSNNKNLIVWNKLVSTGIESYCIYRETDITNIYEKIGTVPYDSLSTYIDNQSVPDVQSNKYRLSILDRHGLESPQSNPHKTMHLAINKGMGNIWNLSWEAYEGFVVSTYNIYRGVSPANLSLIGSTSGSNVQYNDLYAPTGDIYYQLEVISPNTVTPTRIVSSQKTKAEDNDFSSTQISYSSSRSNIATNVISGINQAYKINKINIYPNPVKDELKIDFEGGSTFEILNTMGQAIYNGNLLKNTVVPAHYFPSGVYLIKFKTGNTFEYKRFIKK